LGITGDGTTVSPSEIYCDLGFKTSWASTLEFFATVDGKIANGTVTGLQSAEIGGTASTATPANLLALNDQVVTASPRINLRKQTAWYTARTRGGVSGVVIYMTLSIRTVALQMLGRPPALIQDPQPQERRQ